MSPSNFIRTISSKEYCCSSLTIKKSEIPFCKVRIKVKLKGMSPVDYRVHALKVA
ncbi:IS3 family transposase [Peribacillus sp. NPDC097895]|uniref:IS3 family transposase n=1 Tax=Peribacillus sp. NPDC097895 TaxID=3390619 RepID=UPI003D076D3A